MTRLHEMFVERPPSRAGLGADSASKDPGARPPFNHALGGLAGADKESAWKRA